MFTRSTIAGHTVRAMRVTYVGELGWELHVPIDATGEVFDALMAAGAGFGITPAGYRALESLRLEKGYRAWGSDITPNDTPFEAGLGWAVKLRSNGPSSGAKRAARVANRSAKKRWHASPSTIRPWSCWAAKPSCATASPSAI